VVAWILLDNGLDVLDLTGEVRDIIDIHTYIRTFNSVDRTKKM
jgi:hypothetical protein